MTSKQEATRADKVAQLERAVREVFETDGFRRWSDARRSFRDYSWANQFMIVAQAPEATRVAGYRTWQQLGRQVKKGEHAIRIWAPRMVKVETDDGDERRVGGFVLVPVFDLAQTEGDELPASPAVEITSADYPAALERLETFTRDELAYELTYPESLGGPNGSANLERKAIAVDGALSTDGRLKTLAHECAHVIGDVNYHDYPRARAEVIVEAAAALACQTLGLDTSGYSVAYIAVYGEDGGLDALKTDLGAIDKIATQLEGAILPA